jgi:hypothetical protein
MKWTVKNTSSQTWLATTVDIVWRSGSNLSTGTLFDTTSDVNVGSSTAISLSMKAPSSAGTYTSAWSLRAGANTFCPMSIKIIVP